MDDKHRKYLTDALESLEVIRNNLEEVRTNTAESNTVILTDAIQAILGIENIIKVVEL